MLLTQPIADVMELLRGEEEHRSTSETYEWCQWVTREIHLNKEVRQSPPLAQAACYQLTTVRGAGGGSSGGSS